MYLFEYILYCIYIFVRLLILSILVLAAKETFHLHALYV
jgi:hypothetical protein